MCGHLEKLLHVGGVGEQSLSVCIGKSNDFTSENRRTSHGILVLRHSYLCHIQQPICVHLATDHCQSLRNTNDNSLGATCHFNNSVSNFFFCHKDLHFYCSGGYIAYLQNNKNGGYIAYLQNC